MADIQTEIQRKYGIDIAQENIFKLYKIDNADISPQELELRIQDTRRRWQTSINGANEKNAQRDRARLEKADNYERILKDASVRKKVFQYYEKPAGGTGAGAGGAAGSTAFAKEYFSLIATTKKIRKADVDFFFKYYQSERKNKKAILEMLSKDFKINGLGKEASYADEKEEAPEGKKKNDSSPLIVNLFQEATVLQIRSVIEKYEEAQKSSELCMHYPKLRESLYEFLEIKNIDNAKDFVALMSQRGQEVYGVRQEKGTEYIPLVDLFNKLKSIGDYRDVADNIAEFKLLLKYPNLTPYMFAFVEMKPATIKGMMEVANRSYAFRDETDFILNYYQPVHDNFGINSGGISSVIHKAEKKAKQNKVLNQIDEKLGRKKKRKVSIGAEIIHWLVYWPIFAVYFVFEAVKAIFTRLDKLAILIFIAVFVLSNWLFPKIFGIENLLVIRKIIFKNQWLPFLYELVGEFDESWYGMIVWSLVAIVILLAVYILPALFAALFIAEFADDFNKRFDWVGYERTFQSILQTLRKKTEDQYINRKGQFIKSKLPKAAINILCLAIMFALIYFVPIGVRKLGEVTGYGQKTPKAETLAQQENTMPESNEAEETTEEVLEEPPADVMVISVSSANIRSGPGTEYDVLTTAKKGDTFIATGNQETVSNGTIWYEIYLDQEMTQTGWASQKVIALLE